MAIGPGQFRPGQFRNVEEEGTDTENIVDVEPEQHEPECGWREIGRKILDDNRYEIAVVVLTFIALFMEDVEILLLTETFRNTMEYGRFLLPEKPDPIVCLFCVCFVAEAIEDVCVCVCVCVF